MANAIIHLSSEITYMSTFYIFKCKWFPTIQPKIKFINQTYKQTNVQKQNIHKYMLIYIFEQPKRLSIKHYYFSKQIAKVTSLFNIFIKKKAKKMFSFFIKQKEKKKYHARFYGAHKRYFRKTKKKINKSSNKNQFIFN